MDISSTAALQTTTTSATSQKAAISSDFDTFLKMLTTQMKNQDPLNPVDSSDYAVQLATFSGVEQQQQTNTLLKELGAQFSLLGMSQLAGWVGQEARAAAPVWYSGQAVTLSPNPAAIADRAVLVVKDAQGNLMAREDLPASTTPYQWLGTDAAGDPLPEGRYTLTLESWAGEQKLGEETIESYAKILEARGGVAGTTLVLEGGIEVLATSVTGLRNPAG